MRSRWGSTRRRRSSATPRSTASKFARSTSISAAGTARWSRATAMARGWHCASGCARSRGWPRPMPSALSRRAGRVTATRTTCGCAAGSAAPPWSAAALLPAMPLGEHVVEDYATVGMTLKRHPLAFLRAEFAQEGLVCAADLETLPQDRRLAIAGLALIRQRPGSANGVVFITLEDETGIANLIIWPAVLERFRRAALGATLLYCRGKLQREEGVIHIVAEDLKDMTARLDTLRQRTGNDPLPAGKPPF